MAGRIPVAIVVAVVVIGLLTGCSTDHPRSAVPAGPRSLPAGDSTDAGKPGTVAVAAANARTGRFLWRVPVSGDFQVLSGMVLAAGTLYGQWAACTSDKAGVVAIDVGTGRVRWRTAKLFGGETVPDSLPLSTLGDVYVAIGASDAGTTIVGVDVADGKVRWTRAIGQQTRAAALDRAVVAVIPATNGNITGLDRATGQVLWTRQLPAGFSDWSSVAADDDHVFATYDTVTNRVDSRTIALAARTGRTVWERGGGTTYPGRPGDHVVAFEESHGLVGLDAYTGKQLWKRTDVVTLGDRLDTADGRMVLGTNDRSGTKVVDIATGKDLWTNPAVDVIATRASGIVLWDRTGTETLYDAASGAAIGSAAQLPREPDQMMVPMQIDPEGRVILARGCPYRN